MRRGPGECGMQHRSTRSDGAGGPTTRVSDFPNRYPSELGIVMVNRSVTRSAQVRRTLPPHGLKLSNSSRTPPARRTRTALAAILLLLPHVVRAAWPASPLQNVPLCVTPYSSVVTSAVSDGKGGSIVVWYEDRNGDFDVFARRVGADGAAQWTAN